ncbi:MAG: hypothetical protein COA78_06780 [Blastopirellula sp.]|nr:MAG: hypothetical protein COA78_06780 [Blastopirellula sp.]
MNKVKISAILHAMAALVRQFWELLKMLPGDCQEYFESTAIQLELKKLAEKKLAGAIAAGIAIHHDRSVGHPRESFPPCVNCGNSEQVMPSEGIVDDDENLPAEIQSGPVPFICLGCGTQWSDNFIGLYWGEETAYTVGDASSFEIAEYSEGPKMKGQTTHNEGLESVPAIRYPPRLRKGRHFVIGGGRQGGKTSGFEQAIDEHIATHQDEGSGD